MAERKGVGFSEENRFVNSYIAKKPRSKGVVKIGN